MYKVIIVDDEILIREGIAHGVPWDELGFEIIGQAKNGVEAVELIRGDVPDIVLTDIRMPKMDGIELIEYLKANYPQVKIIIISGYSDVEYFKSAINNRVSEYLLKPTEYNEFEKVFKHMKAALDEERAKEAEYNKLKKHLIESLPFMKEKFLDRLVKGYYTDTEQVKEKLKFYEINLIQDEVAVIVMEVDNFYVVTSGFSEEIKELLRLSVVLTSNNVFRDRQLQGTFFSSSSDEIIGIISNKAHPKIIISAIEEIQKKIYDYKMITISAGISGKCPDIMHIQLYYEQATQALKQKVFFGNQSIVFFSDINVMETPDALPYSFDSSKLINAVFYEEEQKLISFLDDVFNQFERKMVKKYDNIDRLCIEMLFILARHAVQYNIQLEDILEARGETYFYSYNYDSLSTKKKWMLSVLTELNHMIKQIRNDNASIIIRVVKNYLDENFSNNSISLELVADIVNKNPAYVSCLFKNKTGVNFSEYVAKLRVNKAKEHLGDVRVKMYEISSMVGYADASHFTKIFKKYTGVLPSEYRKTAVGHEG